MTPEEYAVDVLRKYRHEVGGVPADPIALGRLIAAAIRAAVDEECLACSQIVEDIAREDSAQRIRDAMNARKEQRFRP